MSEPRWVLRQTVLGLHDRLLVEFGGASGIRDEAMLDSALSRPENRFQYGEATLPELAASYAFELVKNHPFVDGNKRIGFATAAVFLQIQNQPLSVSEVDAVINTLALAVGELDEAGYAAWLSKSC